MKVRFVVLVAATLLAAGPTLAHPPGGELRKMEKSWFGTIDLVEKTSGRSVRFFARGAGLSLFATGDFKTILLEGYYAKAKMSVGYRTISCPGGITGPCGKVDFVSVDAGNNF